MLDVHHGALQSQPLEDGNNYTLGSLNGHNIAILCLAEYGVVAAATAAKAMQFTFPQLRFGLMVGVGGGIPSAEHDIRLGDIVVSLPTGQHGGVIQYDLGRVEADHFERVGSLNKPPTVLRTALSTLRSFGDISKEISTTVDQIRETDEDLKDKWTYPGITKDILFKAEFSHIDKNPTCNECSIVPLSIVSRGSRPTTYPRIHYGNIGSGNSVMKNAKLRDLLSERDNIICFEMESAGLMDSFPCLAIRGICDYADSHKNWQWQPYAAAVAAAFARKLLSVISPLDVARLDSIKGKEIYQTSLNRR
jgi:nucleoside phosphorylase